MYFRSLLFLPSCCVLTLLVMTSCVATTPAPASSRLAPLGDPQVMKIGRQIWQNECAGTVEGLTSWNAGEDFASLGIGHFIWYPEGKRGPFEESFPALIGYLQQQGVRPPAWTIHRPCPWPTKAVFDAQQNSAQMKELRAFLADTVLLQTRFIIARMEASLPKMLQAAPRGRAEHVRAQFYRLAGSTAGMYALIDYVNFKGEGVSPTERYRGQGWGLLQVLDGMPGTTAQPVREFAESGKRVLAQRVRNAPPARNEGRWTAGWNNRMDTYPRF